MADVEPLEKGDCIPFEDTYGTLRAQVFAEADAAIALVLEEAAKVADEVEKRDRQASKEPCDMEEQAAFMRGAFVSRNIAAAIRALKDKP
jgi:hypothetical protein